MRNDFAIVRTVAVLLLWATMIGGFVYQTPAFINAVAANTMVRQQQINKIVNN